MKIHRAGDLPSHEPAAPEAAVRKHQAPPAATGDCVRISGASRGLAAAPVVEPAFDSAKVEAVKAAMANGTFRVDTGKVADALLASVAGLLGRSR